MKNLTALTLLILITSGCASMRIEANKDSGQAVHHSTNYYFLWGVWPGVKMHASEDFCGGPGNLQATTLESTFFDTAITVVTAGLVIPQSMTVQCR